MLCAEIPENFIIRVLIALPLEESPVVEDGQFLSSVNVAAAVNIARV
jgi:hypothetical protein